MQMQMQCFDFILFYFSKQCICNGLKQFNSRIIYKPQKLNN